MHQDIDFFRDEFKSDYTKSLLWFMLFIIFSIASLILVYSQYVELRKSKSEWYLLKDSPIDAVDHKNTLPISTNQIIPKVEAKEIIAYLITHQQTEIAISEIVADKTGGIKIVGIATSIETLSEYILEIEKNYLFAMFSGYTLSIDKQNSNDGFNWEAQWQ